MLTRHIVIQRCDVLQLAVHVTDAAESTVWTAALKLHSVHHAAGVEVAVCSVQGIYCTHLSHA